MERYIATKNGNMFSKIKSVQSVQSVHKVKKATPVKKIMERYSKFHV